MDKEKKTALDTKTLKKVEREQSNFDPETGEKLHETCPGCWVMGNKSYKCDYSKCPGMYLIIDSLKHIKNYKEFKNLK